MDKETLNFYDLEYEYHPNNSRFIDRTGVIFGRLEVLGLCNSGRHPYWFCECECGHIGSYGIDNLVGGRTKSCGCYRNERIREVKATHGLSSTTEYGAWRNARSRCNNQNNKAYDDYGGRGIKFYFKSPQDLIDCIGYRPSNSHSLDRINNDGNYECGNVRWSGWSEQSNNKRSSHVLTYDGKSMTVTQWAEYLGVIVGSLFSRLNYGWSTEDVLGKPFN